MGGRVAVRRGTRPRAGLSGPVLGEDRPSPGKLRALSIPAVTSRCCSRGEGPGGEGPPGAARAWVQGDALAGRVREPGGSRPQGSESRSAALPDGSETCRFPGKASRPQKITSKPWRLFVSRCFSVSVNILVHPVSCSLCFLSCLPRSIPVSLLSLRPSVASPNPQGSTFSPFKL